MIDNHLLLGDKLEVSPVYVRYFFMLIGQFVMVYVLSFLSGALFVLNICAVFFVCVQRRRRRPTRGTHTMSLCGRLGDDDRSRHFRQPSVHRQAEASLARAV